MDQAANKEKVRMDLCVDVLSEGFIDSYIELFYLLDSQSQSVKKREEDELIFLKESLVMAEVSGRKNDLFGRHAAFSNIGHYFASNKESESAIYFFSKCADILARDANVEAQHFSSYLDLALAYESLKEIDCAIRFHEKYLSVCREFGDDAKLVIGNKNLIRSLKLQSDQMAECGEYEQAMAVLEKCIVFGQSAHDLKGQQIAHKSIANISLLKLEKYQKAALHFKKFIKLSLELEDVDGEGFGYWNLGKTYQQLGDNVLATKYYESYLKVAGTAEAAAALGDIYSLCERHQDAKKYYAQNLDISKQQNRKDDADAARIKLAIASSKLQISEFIGAINGDDINQLIQWKNKRKPIQKV